MSEYAFYSFKDEALREWGLEPTPMPVRRELEEAIFGGEKVRVDLLLDELDLFLGEFPDLRDLYAATSEAMTYLAGMNLGMEGDAEAAARYLAKGLEARPESLLLRSNYALALQLQGKGGEALAQYKVVLAHPEGNENPMVRLLAARLFAEQEQYLEAYRLLDEMARGLPTDDAFWDFLSEMKELAGVEGAEGEATATAKVAEPQQAVCTGCGKPLRKGWDFCVSCGKPAGGKMEPEGKTVAAQVFCTNCGRPVREGCAFCTVCGKPV